MRYFIFFVGCFIAFQIPVQAQSEMILKVDRINRRIRKEIVLMHENDQYWRMLCIAAKMDKNSVACRKVTSVDRQNTRRLGQIIKKYGFPNDELVGLDVVGNVHTILIHSPSIEFQKENLPYLQKAAEQNSFLKPEVALLTDKILVNENKPQIYGTQFKTENGKMLLRETIEPEKLDERRREMSLPPMEDYIKSLEKMYRMEVVRP